MSDTMMDEFATLHGLRVRGMTTVEPLAESTGLPVEEIQRVLDDAVAAGLARSRTGGRVEGYMLTGAGRERHEELRSKRVTREDQDALAPAYEAFLKPNQAFKELTTVWQTEAAGDVTVVLPRLLEVHEELRHVLSIAAASIPRMGLYQARFDTALAGFREGDGDALARPMSGSYHDVWMELHEDLLLTLGRERTDDDG